jgi:hypothetical protein
MAYVVYDAADFLQGHTVHGFWCRTFVHGSIVAIDFAVGLEVQLRVIELSIHVFER